MCIGQQCLVIKAYPEGICASRFDYEDMFRHRFMIDSQGVLRADIRQ